MGRHPATIPRDDFLSPAEAGFFQVLRGAVPAGNLIFPKVRLADLVYAPKQAQHYAAWQRINRKHVDFVVCDARTLRPILVLELDDRSHRRPDRVERDAFVDRVFAEAGLPILRIPAQRGYQVRVLAGLIAEIVPAPAAPTDESAPADFAAIASDPSSREMTSASAQAGATEPPICERCGGTMQRRVAKQGSHAGKAFWGCTNYPHCRNTIPA